jgi:hypothetical protein
VNYKQTYVRYITFNCDDTLGTTLSRINDTFMEAIERYYYNNLANVFYSYKYTSFTCSFDNSFLRDSEIIDLR